MWTVEKIVSKGDYDYAVVKGHPNATKHGYVLHHRIIVENALGRLLLNTEIVHHKNHKKKDNRKRNLEVLDSKTQSRLHAFERGRKWVKLKCPQCDEIFRKPHNTTHLVKPSKYKCTCCSPRCRGQFYAFIKYKGMNKSIRKAIKRNKVRVYRKFEIMSP